LDEVIRYISQFGIIKLESAPPTLEDLFLRHYAVEDPSGAGVGGQQ
jgi:ABC-2 type transport system ATP-binding protein